jgi:dethiobiotin synthetase
MTLFVTGTDTGVGKTFVTCGLLRAARAAGIDAVGFKPVASGSRVTPQGLRNADALALIRAAGTRDEPYERINPVALHRAVAPHLAARAEGRRIDLRAIEAAHRRLAARHDLVLAEGAGGWQVPLDAQRTTADWVEAQGWPVLLVVGMRLGCLSHALLSAESIQRRSRLLGWVASVVPPRQPRLAENVADLAARMPVPLLGIADGRRGRQEDTFATILQGLGAVKGR